MIIELQQTTASKVAQALLHGRQVAGSPAMGMVMTMVVVCEEKDFPPPWTMRPRQPWNTRRGSSSWSVDVAGRRN